MFSIFFITLYFLYKLVNSKPLNRPIMMSISNIHQNIFPVQQAPAAPRKPMAEAGGVRKSAAASAPLLQLQAGESVTHDAFGKGMVLSVRPMGNDALIEVAFDKVGTKKLMLKAAGSHLKKG